MRLIDADALLKWLSEWELQEAPWWGANGYGDAKVAETIKEAIDAVEQMPTIDAVHVVRCRDCRMTERDYLNICYTLGFIEGVVDGSNLPKEIKDAVFVAVQSIQSTIHKEFDIAERSD